MMALDIGNIVSANPQLPLEAVSFGWSRDHPPVLVVPSGSEIFVEAGECSNGQITRDSTAEAIRTIDFARVDPITGPVFVEGAHPGDVLQVDLLWARRPDRSR